MLHADALKLIQETAQKAQTPVKIDVFTAGRKAYHVVNGQVTDFDVPPANRQHVVKSLDDLIAYANALAADADKPNGPHPVIWHHGDSGCPCGDAVVCVCDDADRRDTVTFPLTRSEPFALLSGMNPGRFSQRDFVRLLRFKLGYTGPALDLFKRLEWKSGVTATGTVGRGQESLGKQIMAQVTGVDELPEEIEFDAPVYRERGEQTPYRVRCGLDYDVPNQTILMAPLPGEIDRAVEMAQASIRDRLENELVLLAGHETATPVYYGKP